MTIDQMVAILGVLVAVLGVLFTAGAIVAAVLIFQQSRDYRARLEDAHNVLRASIAQHQQQLAAYIAQKDAELQAMRESTEQRIKLLEENNETASKDTKARNDEELARLRRDLNLLSMPKPPVIPNPSGAAFGRLESSLPVLMTSPHSRDELPAEMPVANRVATAPEVLICPRCNAPYRIIKTARKTMGDVHTVSCPNCSLPQMVS